MQLLVRQSSKPPYAVCGYAGGDQENLLALLSLLDGYITHRRGLAEFRAVPESPAIRLRYSPSGMRAYAVQVNLYESYRHVSTCKPMSWFSDGYMLLYVAVAGSAECPRGGGSVSFPSNSAGGVVV